MRINRNKLKCYTHRIVTIYIFNKIANSFKCPYRSIFSKKLFQVSLSLMYEGMKMEKAFTVSIQPMEMYSFILSRQSKSLGFLCIRPNEILTFRFLKWNFMFFKFWPCKFLGFFILIYRNLTLFLLWPNKFYVF